MNYYDILPASHRYHGKTALTYSSPQKLADAQVVEIKLRNFTVPGVVTRRVARPDFKTESIVRPISGLKLTQNQIQLLRWTTVYYPSGVGVTAGLFLPVYLLKFKNLPAQKPAHFGKINNIKPSLNAEQKPAYAALASAEDAGSSVLLGVTGSGKTRLYMELAKDAVNSGKSVLILTPEIGLTASLYSQFKRVFGGRVELSHSGLPAAQRVKSYQNIYLNDHPKIIVGPRSALFLPHKNLGLIVVDEFHEPAYKQDDAPRYHANRVASRLAHLSGAKLVFASATPPVADYYLAELKKSRIIELRTSALTNKPPVINKLVVDLSDKTQRTPHPLISKTLIEEISAALLKKEQVMVFLNKRGSYRSVICKDCGWQLKCPRCELPLIYHQDGGRALCHTCGFKAKLPASCPECKSVDILFTSPGTKTIVQSLSKIFPGSKIIRFDKDNKKHEKIESNFKALMAGEVDIIVGTQMITKGFDLPKLSLVVMLITESSLSFPDFSSSERSYQLVKQFAGRVNRGHRKGKIILQTFKPGSELLSAAEKPWIEFYRNELEKRKLLGFPPFYHSLKIQFSAGKSLTAEIKLQVLAEKIKRDYPAIKTLGPSPGFIEKRSNKYYWQLIALAKSRKDLVSVAAELPGSFKVDLDPLNFL